MDRQTEEIRKAFERLQRTVEQGIDQLRTLQRERRLFLERINELEEERSSIGASLSEQSVEANRGRERTAELEELLLRAEREQERLHTRVLELERVMNERESLIADQEDALM